MAGDNGGVDVELLVVPDCPNKAGATALVRDVLDELGLTETAVPIRVIDSQAEAERACFAGSPTILIDGVDPFAERHGAFGLTCRVYATPIGLRGLPDPDALRAALRHAHNLAS